MLLADASYWWHPYLTFFVFPLRYFTDTMMIPDTVWSLLSSHHGVNNSFYWSRYMWLTRWQMRLNCMPPMRDQGLVPYLSDIWWDGVWLEPWDVIVFFHSEGTQGEGIKYATAQPVHNGDLYTITKVTKLSAARKCNFSWKEGFEKFCSNNLQLWNIVIHCIKTRRTHLSHGIHTFFILCWIAYTRFETPDAHFDLIK